MGDNPRGPDYGVFNFVELFREAQGITKQVSEMTTTGKRNFFGRFEHDVSDHTPLWLRLPLPDV